MNTIAMDERKSLRLTGLAGIIGTILFIYAILFKKTSYPKWMVLFSPTLLILTSPLARILPAPVDGIL